MRIETLTIICRKPDILLAKKKVRFGKGKYNGFGGGLKEGESLEKCAVRETLDESGSTILNPEKMGEILFQFENGEQDHLVHIYKAVKFYGVPRESDEMDKPEWFNEKKIPYGKMLPSDKYWFPFFLGGKKFKGNMLFGLDSKIKNYKLEEVQSLD